VLLAWVLWLGCGRPEAPAELAACSALADLTAREDCRLKLLEPLFESKDAGAFQRALDALEDPASRDLVRLRLAIRDPNRGGRLCEQVETKPAQRKCRQVLGRPHLRGQRHDE
jgi:hypothetical protein